MTTQLPFSNSEDEIKIYLPGYVKDAITEHVSQKNTNVSAFIRELICTTLNIPIPPRAKHKLKYLTPAERNDAYNQRRRDRYATMKEAYLAYRKGV